MKLLFIHIPKTGGTSITKFLNHVGHNDWKRSWPMGHDPYFDMEENNIIDNNVFTFTMVRNPYTRAYSYYKHYVLQNDDNISFYDFLHRVRIKKNTSKTPMTIYNQSFYTFGKRPLSRVYKFEKFNQLEEDLEVELPKLRVGKYSKEEMIDSYTYDIIKLVKHIYFEDFINFSYSFDISDATK